MKDTTVTLRLIAISQIYLEALEDYAVLPQNKFKRKSLIKQLIPELEIDANKEFLQAFQLDEETLRIVQQSYEMAINSISTRDVPSAVIQAQLWEAYKLDPDSMQANTHRILKKYSK